MEQPKNAFLIKHAEKELLNQYWYSPFTISRIVKELEASCTQVAFLSTPSIYFSLPKGSPLRAASWVLDFDPQWASDPHFVLYDFHKPEELPAHLHGTFDGVVIDPPFITHEVWKLYAQAARLLLKPGGKVIATTVAENKGLMQELLQAAPAPFAPSIPHLVYQYNLYTNFDPVVLCEVNPEIPLDD